MLTPPVDSKTVKRSISWGICAALMLIVVAAYWPLAGYEFIGYDDNDYVWQNPHVLGGLSWPGAVWAFIHFHVGNWHPLTWLSHMLDVQWYGLNAGGHHATSLVFHVINTLLLFLWLQRLTGFTWRSALVAALFGLHPLHVESVAWVAERKDVLSTFFFLLALWAYTRYVQKSEIRSQKSETNHPASTAFAHAPFYWLGLACFALGLMSKPMVVTLPFVFLLLDYWPLNRIQNSEFRIQNLKGLLMEKVPFFVLSAGSCVVTVLAQQSGNAVMSVNLLPVTARIQNALVSYATYLKMMFWPDALAVFYPLQRSVDADQVVMAAFVLVLVTVGVLFCWRQRPYLAVGWFWYLGTLVPVIGLVQVGNQAMADRYTYVPLIGVFIALVWLVAEIKIKWPYRRWLLSLLSVIVLGVCWQLTAAQVRCWQNGETLSRHALAVTKDNALMQGLLGSSLFEQGKMPEAAEHLAEAARLWPGSISAQYDLAMALAAQDKMDEAIATCQTALKFKPHSPQIHHLLGNLFSKQGKIAEAIGEYRTTLEIDPDNLVDLNNLAWLLATTADARLRDGPEAIRLAEKACQITNYEKPMFIGTLAAAYAEAGRFDEAAAAAQKAITLATAAKNEGLVQKNGELLELYRLKKAYHEPAGQ